MMGRFLLVAMLLLLLSSCSFLIKKDIYLEYESAFVDARQGRWIARLGTTRIQTRNNYQFFDITQADALLFHYESSGSKFRSVKLKNIKLVSLASEEVLIDSEKLEKKSPKGSGVFAGVGIHGISLPYHDYQVSFDYVIYGLSGSIQDKGSLEMVLSRDFYEGYGRRGGADRL